MAQIHPAVSKIEMHLTLIINEEEARALEHISGYSVNDILVALSKMTNLQRHEAGIQAFFESVRKHVPVHLARLDKAKEAFKG